VSAAKPGFRQDRSNWNAWGVPALAPELVLCAVDEPMANAWLAVADGRLGVRVHRGSVLDIHAQAIVSPANSQGWMRGGIDAVYATAFPHVENNVRSAVLALHGGELPVGEAQIVATGETEPAWLISAPTMSRPGEHAGARHRGGRRRAVHVRASGRGRVGRGVQPAPRLTKNLCTTLWTELWMPVDYWRGATHRSRSSSSVMGMPKSPTAGISGFSLRASRTASGLNAASLNPRRW
jgi:hypothetical protein